MSGRGDRYRFEFRWNWKRRRAAGQERKEDVSRQNQQRVPPAERFILRSVFAREPRTSRRRAGTRDSILRVRARKIILRSPKLRATPRKIQDPWPPEKWMLMFRRVIEFERKRIETSGPSSWIKQRGSIRIPHSRNAISYSSGTPSWTHGDAPVRVIYGCSFTAQ